MKPGKLIEFLEQFSEVLPPLVTGLSEADVRWKPPSGAWSILEIVCHLGDEEEYDFRTRVASTLEDSSQPWPPIDPEGWATERGYNQQEIAPALQRFVTLRQQSIDWLRGLEAPNWDNVYNHPSAGKLHAGDVLASWVAHDSLHLRQIAKRRYELTIEHADGFAVRYAGDW